MSELLGTYTDLMSELLDPSDPRAPKYWMNETSGVLHWVVERYLNGENMSPRDLDIMRAYLQQWIDSPVWEGAAGLETLRLGVRRIRTRRDIEGWLADALRLGHDPL